MRLLPAFVPLALAISCSQPPAMITDARKAELLRSIQRELTRSIESEKSAVLATTDEESERFAAESRKASAQLDLLRKELRTLATSAELEKLDAFDRAWEQVEAVDSKLLTLATANTNLKAARLSAHEATAALDQVLASLHDAEARNRDPARLRELSDASVAALRIQALHAPHIASPDPQEMTALETRIAALQQQVDAVLAKPTPADSEALAAAKLAWTDYVRLTQTIFTLSRTNTNVLSFGLSVHEKREATRACEEALRELVNQVHDVPRPSR